MTMAHVISLATSKGGTGKTTTALNLAVALAELGRRTILVDLDPQGAVGLALARGDTDWVGLAEVMMEAEPLEQVVIQTKVPSLAILPRGRLDPVDICEYEAHLHSSGAIKDVVTRVGEDRDYVIIDNPSGLGMITRAALSASDLVLVPLQAEPMALRSVGQVLRVLDHVRQTDNPGIQLLGVLPTMVQLDQEVSLNVMGTVWSQLGGVLETVIPRAEAFARASEIGIPVAFLAGPTPTEARRFDMLAAEVENRVAQLTGARRRPDDQVQRELI